MHAGRCGDALSNKFLDGYTFQAFLQHHSGWRKLEKEAMETELPHVVVSMVMKGGSTLRSSQQGRGQCVQSETARKCELDQPAKAEMLPNSGTSGMFYSSKPSVQRKQHSIQL